MKIKEAFVVIFLLFGILGAAQTTETELLLEQAEQMAHFNPTEANRISEHIFKLSNNASEKAKSGYVQAVSLYVMGQYGPSLDAAFQAKRMAVELGNDEVTYKCNGLIDRTLRTLLLNAPKQVFQKKKTEGEAAFRAEDLLLQAGLSLLRNEIDSAAFFTEKAKKEFSSKESTWTDAIYWKIRGDIHFKEMKIDSSVIDYQMGLNIAKEINNPFILHEINQKLANSYLAMDSISKFQEHTQMAEKLDSETVKLENEAANSAHMLISKDLDRRFEQNKNRFQKGLWSVLGLVVLAAFLKIIFFVRNRNKLKMFRNMLDYLNRQNLAEQTERAVIQEEKPEIQKAPTLLKESENQILAGLEKFEAGKKFTHKDMSLGMLAAQLNTNTKYLSEVINRQKQKNFNSYINELRINYITEKIKSDASYLNFKVSYLAEECGFSSHSTFTTVFKSIVGVSPIMFVEFVKEEMKREKLEPAFHD